MSTAVELAPLVGVVAACWALGAARATFYRPGQTRPRVSSSHRKPSPWALSVFEQQHILDVLHAPAYVDQSPRTVFAMLLDAGHYLASVSTFYRLLRGLGETRGRRSELTHPAYAKPELLARAPRELWSWDISVPQQAA
jgi:putative transposase